MPLPGSRAEFHAPVAQSDIPSAPAGVILTTLTNGLTLIIREDHSAPVVSAQAWCMAGSIHEGRFLGAGMSHVLEHMLFKGTKARPGSRIDQEVQEAGGYMNAYTSFDRTVYHIDVPSTGADTAISILCDIMQNATLPEDELEKEKQVILREMDMNMDDPGRRASRRLFESAFSKSPYRFTIIGYPDLFHTIRREHLLDYYREKYAPNNTFFVIVGDLKAEKVVDYIKASYADTKARPLPPTYLQNEPVQTAPRELFEEAPIELGYAHYAWHIPDLRHPDVPSLDVLAALLGNGRSSRLYQSVRQTQGLVNSVDAWTYSPGETGLFGISSTFSAEKLNPAREAILEELTRMKEKPVASSELGKAVKQFVAGTLASRKTMQGQAQDLGSSWLAANDLNFSRRYLAAVQRVTPEDLQRVARTYLTPENRTLFALLPTGTAPKSVFIEEVTSVHLARKYELQNGLRLLVKEDKRLPFVEFRAVFRGGVLAETLPTNGLTQLTAKMLLKGTRNRSGEEIALAIESMGGSIDSYGGNNSLGLNVEVMQEDFATALDILKDVLLNPAFDLSALQREREIQLAGIRARKDHLLQRAFHIFRRGLFGETGYGLDPQGSESSVQKIQRGQLVDFHRQFIVPKNCVLAIYGHVDAERLHAELDTLFADWTAAGNATLELGGESPMNETSRRVAEHPDKNQAVIVVGWPGTTLSAPERYALDLLQEACSDLGSRLFMRIREELGLAYYVGAQHFPGLRPGYFSFYAGTSPEHAARVEKELLEEAEALRQDGLSDEELKRAKAKVLGQRKIARQELGALAMTAALDELHGLGFDHSEKEDSLLESVTLDDVRAAAQKYFVPGNLVTATVSPCSKPQN